MTESCSISWPHGLVHPCRSRRYWGGFLRFSIQKRPSYALWSSLQFGPWDPHSHTRWKGLSFFGGMRPRFLWANGNHRVLVLFEIAATIICVSNNVDLSLIGIGLKTS